MAKIHYHPYANVDEWDYDDKFYCGTSVGDEVNTSSYWHDVTCKKCLKQRHKIENIVLMQEKDIIRQMQ